MTDGAGDGDLPFVFLPVMKHAEFKATINANSTLIPVLDPFSFDSVEDTQMHVAPNIEYRICTVRTMIVHIYVVLRF